jgi:hypothetical protein
MRASILVAQSDTLRASASPTIGWAVAPDTPRCF